MPRRVLLLLVLAVTACGGAQVTYCDALAQADATGRELDALNESIRAAPTDDEIVKLQNLTTAYADHVEAAAAAAPQEIQGHWDSVAEYTELILGVMERYADTGETGEQPEEASELHASYEKAVTALDKDAAQRCETGFTRIF